MNALSHLLNMATLHGECYAHIGTPDGVRVIGVTFKPARATRASVTKITLEGEPISALAAELLLERYEVAK